MGNLSPVRNGRALLPRVIQVLVGCCEVESPVVHQAACSAMRLSIASCMTGEALDEEGMTAMKEAVTAAEKLLEYR